MCPLGYEQPVPIAESPFKPRGRRRRGRMSTEQELENKTQASPSRRRRGHQQDPDPLRPAPILAAPIPGPTVPTEQDVLNENPQVVPMSQLLPSAPLSASPTPVTPQRPVSQHRTPSPMSPQSETFNLNVGSSPTSSSRSYSAPSTPPRQGYVPRSGPHSPNRHMRRGPAGNRKSKGDDAWTFFEKENGRRKCIFCKHIHGADKADLIANYSMGTSSGTVRQHLIDDHLGEWIESCDKLGLNITAKQAQRPVAEYRQQREKLHAQEEPGIRKVYSREAFVDAIVEFIVGDDEAINVIESKRLRAIFLLLRAELKESDIPGRTTIHKRIDEILEDHLCQLEKDMRRSVGKISFTTDMWTDSNLSPFMAVTAHWIEAEVEQTPSGPHHILKLRADLIGFQRVPGHHSGEHLAHAFLYVTDRLAITERIGWITVDNASNNDTFMATLERELSRRRIKFCKVERHIRCFPHIVNLACKAVLEAITHLPHAAVDAAEYVPNSPTPTSFMEALQHDPIATIRSLIRAIRASSLRRHHFATVLEAIEKDLQLLRDVDTRWSSTLLMIDRAIILRDAIHMFLENNEFRELRKFELADCEWEALEIFRNILEVPHAFQQILSFEKTPTLGNTLPAYEAMKKAWKRHQVEYLNTATIVQDGLDKLETYRNRATLVPAYVLALIINPSEKLDWYYENLPDKAQEAKDLFVHELAVYRSNDSTNLQAANINIASPVEQQRANEILGLGCRRNHTMQRTLEAEVDAYLNDTHGTSSSLIYWQENRERYPTIFRLAMDILPVQGSSVPCERVFSSSKETMSARRNRISPELMEALQLLKFSVRQGRGLLNFTMGFDREEELAELETIMKAERRVPEDINSFIESLLHRVD